VLRGGEVVEVVVVMVVVVVEVVVEGEAAGYDVCV
jgi:hypothetical protein